MGQAVPCLAAPSAHAVARDMNDQLCPISVLTGDALACTSESAAGETGESAAAWEVVAMAGRDGALAGRDEGEHARRPDAGRAS